MTVLRALLIAAALVLVTLIAWAFANASFSDSFAAIAADPWGLVSLVDLYLGFLVAAALVAHVERRWVAAAWIVALVVLGNVVAALWLAWRLPLIAAALKDRFRTQPPAE